MKSGTRALLIVFGGILVILFGWFGYTAWNFYALHGTQQEVRFESRGTTLAGTWIKPGHEESYPAAVLLHGAGQGTRSDAAYRAHARILLDAGFAVLIYDKRGSGESGGRFKRDAYDEFIADAIAAVEFVKARPDVRPGCIGLLGASESGWFTPEVAHQVDAAFVINKAGSPLSWIDTVLWESRWDMLAQGMPLHQVERELDALGTTWRLMVAKSHGEPAESAQVDAELAEAIEQIRALRPDAEQTYSHLLTAYEEGTIKDYTKRHAYDPAPYLAALDIPALYLFAENDVNVPTARAVMFLERLGSETGADVTAHVFDGTGHTLYARSGLLTGGYPPNYRGTIANWLSRHVLARGGPRGCTVHGDPPGSES